MDRCHIADNVHVIIIDNTVIVQVFELCHTRVSQLSCRAFVHTIV